MMLLYYWIFGHPLEIYNKRRAELTKQRYAERFGNG